MANIALGTSATGLSALNTKLDIIANNLANLNTDGFKSTRANFEDLLYDERRLPGTENTSGDQTPTGLYVGLGVRVAGTQLDFQQGPLVTTGNPLDIAIDGDGFFRVQVDESISADGVAYTRAGNFTVDADGELVLAFSGSKLDPPITVPEGTTGIDITTDGVVWARFENEGDLTELGQIELANFINPEGLIQLGGNLMAASQASGPEITATPGTAGIGTVQNGFLEGSNVDPTVELVELIRTQRAFEMNSQVIRAADETLRSVSQLRR